MLMKGEKMIKTSSSLGSRMRKRLSDITNLNSQHKSPFKNLENDFPSAANDSSSSYTKTYIDQILKENATMTKLIEEKDKIIESKGVELETVRVNLQRTQLQNYQLAQTNSQMLAELNMAKDRLKNLQHEFICKDALFKAMAIQLKEGETKPAKKLETKPVTKIETKPEEPAVEEQLLEQNDNVEENKVSKAENEVSKRKRGRPARSQSMGSTMLTSQQAVDKENKVSKAENEVSKTRRGRPARRQSMGATTSTSQQAVNKEIIENKRRCLRRQSAMLKPSEKPDNLFEIDVASKSRRKSNSDVVSDSEECLSETSKYTGAREPSIGRPQRRRATEKVQSYKEPLLKTKMRRPV